MKTYEIKRTVIEYFNVDAESKKEALKIVKDRGNPARIIIKSETVREHKTLMSQ